MFQCQEESFFHFRIVAAAKAVHRTSNPNGSQRLLIFVNGVLSTVIDIMFEFALLRMFCANRLACRLSCDIGAKLSENDQPMTCRLNMSITAAE